MKRIALTLLAATAFLAQAAVLQARAAGLANLPDLSGATEIGRVTLYASVHPLSWLQPTAFSSTFECTSGKSHRTCTLRLFNFLSAAEKARLDELTAEQGLSVVPFADLDGRVVSGITEEFSGLPADVEAQSQSMRTLRLTDDKFPYGSAMFRVPADQAAGLEEAYRTQGLGRFTVRFNVNAIRTRSYLAIRDGNCLKELLRGAQGKSMSKDKVNGYLDQAIRKCGTAYAGFAEDELVGYMRPQLRNTFFSGSWWSGYSVKPDEVERIGDVYVFNDDQEPPRTLACVTELELRDGASARTVCQ